MVDLQPVFATARSLAADAVTTSGCTVRIFTEVDTVDADTLTEQHQTVTLAEGPALVRDAAGIAAALPGLTVHPGDYVVSMLPSVTTPPAGAAVEVVTAVAGAPAGRLGAVEGAVRDAAGALLRLLVRP